METRKTETRPWQRHYDYDVPTTIRYPRVPAHDLMQVSVNADPEKSQGRGQEELKIGN